MSDSTLAGGAVTTAAARARRDRGGALGRPAGGADPSQRPTAVANAPGGTA